MSQDDLPEGSSRYVVVNVVGLWENFLSCAFARGGKLLR